MESFTIPSSELRVGAFYTFGIVVSSADGRSSGPLVATKEIVLAGATSLTM